MFYSDIKTVGDYTDEYVNLSGDISRRISRWVIDIDAVSEERNNSEGYVRLISKMTDEEFALIKSEIETQLKIVPIRLTNCIEGTGYQNFCVNYLFASEDKLFRIRSLGKKSVVDFREIRESLIEFVIGYVDECFGDELNLIKDIIKDIPRKKYLKGKYQHLSLKELIEDKSYELWEATFRVLARDLSVRSQHAIDNYTGNFIENFVWRNNKAINLNKVGERTSAELSRLAVRLNEYVLELGWKLSDVTSEDVLKLEKYKAVLGEWIDDFSCEYFNEKKHFPMLRILGNWLRERSEKSRNWSLFFSYFPIFDEDIRPIKELSEEYDLTEERCRQICRIYIKKFKIPEGKDTEGLSAILKKSNEWSYLQERFSSKKIVTEYDLSSLLEEEQSSLSVTFCSFILGILLGNKYSRVGPKVFPCDADWDWKRNFLIGKEYSDIFDFSGALKEIKDKESTLSEAEYYPAEEIVEVSRCWHDYNPTFTEDISGILSKILIDELDMYPDENDRFKLTAREEVSPTEFIYRIVRETGCPMSLEDVFGQLDRSYPSKYKSSESVKGLVRRDNRMSIVNNGCQVGLLEWSHIRFGSIRDIIVAYLSQFDEPQPLSDIVKHVNKDRESSENSIRSSLNDGDQFCRFVGNLYGLKTKEYGDGYEFDTSRRKSIDERLYDLEIFLKSNKRFPLANSDDKEEASLGRFWYNLKRKVRKGEANPEECEAVEGIEKAYSDCSVNREADDWMELYNSYKKFVLEYGRKPESRTPEEERLYQWFLNSKQGFEDERLSETQEELYRSLCKIL